MNRTRAICSIVLLALYCAGCTDALAPAPDCNRTDFLIEWKVPSGAVYDTTSGFMEVCT